MFKSLLDDTSAGGLWMFIISERINGLFRSVGRAIDNRDSSKLLELVEANIKAGANALDINTGPGRDNAEEDMQWMIRTVQDLTDLTLSIDTPKASVMKAGMEVCENPIIINSITAEADRMAALFPLAAEADADIICLTLSEKGVPNDADSRAELAMLLTTSAMEHGIETDKLLFDPLILPANVAQDQPQEVFKAIKMFQNLASPPPRTVVGLSNISSGCKERKLINRTMLAMLAAHGLSAAILDPLDEEMMKTVKTCEILMNERLYADAYLRG